MKYLQAYKSKELQGGCLKLESSDFKDIILSKEETILYNCFFDGITLQEAYQKTYNNDIAYIEFFNDSITTWYKLGILVII